MYSRLQGCELTGTRLVLSLWDDSSQGRWIVQQSSHIWNAAIEVSGGIAGWFKIFLWSSYVAGRTVVQYEHIGMPSRLCAFHGKAIAKSGPPYV